MSLDCNYTKIRDFDNLTENELQGHLDQVRHQDACSATSEWLVDREMLKLRRSDSKLWDSMTQPEKSFSKVSSQAP